MNKEQDILNVMQVLEGKTGAFSNIVARHSSHAFNLAFRICGNREDAEEITQDSFMKVYRSLRSFRMKSSFSTWLYRIVYNTAISCIRAKKLDVLLLDDFPAGLKDFSEENTNDDKAEAEYRLSLVNFALQKISSDDRAIISLYYYEDMSLDEIAGITGYSEANVKIRLFRARQKMLGILQKNEKKKVLS